MEIRQGIIHVRSMLPRGSPSECFSSLDEEEWEQDPSQLPPLFGLLWDEERTSPGEPALRLEALERSTPNIYLSTESQCYSLPSSWSPEVCSLPSSQILPFPTTGSPASASPPPPPSSFLLSCSYLQPQQPQSPLPLESPEPLLTSTYTIDDFMNDSVPKSDTKAGQEGSNSSSLRGGTKAKNNKPKKTKQHIGLSDTRTRKQNWEAILQDVQLDNLPKLKGKWYWHLRGKPLPSLVVDQSQ